MFFTKDKIKEIANINQNVLPKNLTLFALLKI
ncbi:MAG: hypothetical protein Ta2D_02010 [Rickettsiales bacterium]|nr:MAG: hypothetical protein Ta2D_02010 [Rickettsiales bacterium]